MDTKERLNKMARLVFNKANLDQIKEGIVCLFDLLIEVLSAPFEHGNYMLLSEIMARFESVEQKKWRPIRNIFLLDPFYGYVQGDFTEEEESSPAKILLDFIKLFNQIHEDCMTKLEEYQTLITTLSKEKREVEARLAKLEMKDSEQRLAASVEKTEIKTARSTIEFLEKAIKEKNEKIAELQREKNVQLWEREKEKVLAVSKEKMEALEAKVAFLQRQNDSLNKKFIMVDSQNKRLKLRSELMSGDILSTTNKSEEDLKRQIYLLEKDVTALERELYSQQRVFSTVLIGIKTDLYIVGENLTDPDTGTIPFKNFVRLNGVVDSLAEALANGDIDQARSKLPPHYTYLPSDFKVKRVKRVSHLPFNLLPPLQRKTVKSNSKPGEEINEMPSGDEDYFSTERPVESNPELVDPQTNAVNFVTCMRHFPHLSVDFIKEHWAKFKEFDVNGDAMLDFAEVVRALSSMGFCFSAQQAEEAMKEADVNRSRSLDFFEYVLVADKLINKSGKSELFHTGIANQDRKVVAKTCAVQ